MAYPPPLRLRRNPLYPVLLYSDSFSSPLSSREVWFWQVHTRFSRPHILRLLSAFPRLHSYYFLPRRSSLVSLRLSRNRTSRPKWQIAAQISHSLSRIPTVLAVFVTGALAMDNSPADDDIDIMVISSPHTLWLTRFFVSLYLKLLGIRRNPHLPEHSSPRVRDKICDNLWLDSGYLSIFSHNLYLAHEILQAKCLFDRGGIYSQFLSANAWVGDYLPVAYRESIKNCPPGAARSVAEGARSGSLKIKNFTVLLWPVNLLFFLVQYLYMHPRLSREKIGLGYALFHPRPPPDCGMI